MLLIFYMWLITYRKFSHPSSVFFFFQRPDSVDDDLPIFVQPNIVSIEEGFAFNNRGVARIFPYVRTVFHLTSSPPTPPPPKKRSKSFSIHVSFISNRVRKSLNWIQINLFFCLLFLWVSMCERHCLSCESTTFCSSPFASIYVTYYKKQQCVHGFFSYTNENSLHRWPTKSHRFSKETDIGMWKNNFVVQVQK